jgi:hypothetical protein
MSLGLLTEIDAAGNDRRNRFSQRRRRDKVERRPVLES